MSTDVVKFPQPGLQVAVNVDALKFFLAISLPLVCITFLAWGASYLWSTRTYIGSRKRFPVTQNGENSLV